MKSKPTELRVSGGTSSNPSAKEATALSGDASKVPGPALTGEPTLQIPSERVAEPGTGTTSKVVNPPKLVPRGIAPISGLMMPSQRAAQQEKEAAPAAAAAVVPSGPSVQDAKPPALVVLTAASSDDDKTEPSVSGDDSATNGFAVSLQMPNKPSFIIRKFGPILPYKKRLGGIGPLDVIVNTEASMGWSSVAAVSLQQ